MVSDKESLKLLAFRLKQFCKFPPQSKAKLAKKPSEPSKNTFLQLSFDTKAQ